MASSPTVAISLPDGFRLGGVTRWSEMTAREIVQQGGSAALLVHPYRHRDTIPDIDTTGVQTLNCGDNSVMRLSPKSVETYQRATPAVFIPNYTDGPYATCATIASKDPESLRVIGFCHTFEDRYFDWLTHYEPMIHRYVAVSRQCADELMRRLPHRRDDVEIMNYPVEAPAELHREWSSPNEPIELIYAGRIVERQKRVSLLLELAEKLFEMQVNFRLRIFGDGSHYHWLRRRINRLPNTLAKRLELHAAVSQQTLHQLLDESDICLLVSEFEGFSIFMTEAMARGCVPVVTKVSGSSGFVDSGENGFLAPVGDLQSLAEKVKLLADDRNRLTDMGHSAHHATLSLPQPAQYASQLRELADDVWNTESPRPWPKQRRLFPLHRYLIYRAASLIPYWETRSS